MKEKETAMQKPKSEVIKIEDLVPFENHPYKVIDNENMNDLIESIREHGILNPLIVRPAESEDGKYEIISGHRRFHATQKLEMKKLPCTVHFVDRDAAPLLPVGQACFRDWCSARIAELNFIFAQLKA